MWPVFTIVGAGLFAIGTVVGSFVNVCVHRIPWQKSLVWPGSRCPKCLAEIAARDNIPILGWLLLRGKCRNCGARIAPRYPIVEALVGLLFLAAYVVDVLYGPRTYWGDVPVSSLGTWFYHAVLIALLVAATFIDYDTMTIPDQITVTGMIIGIGLGCAFPEIRPIPAVARTHWEGFWVGLTGLLVGGGLTWSARTLGSLALRREAMGFGDVTLMAMIGSFLGWQMAILTFFGSSFCGIAHALWKLVAYVGKRLAGAKTSSADREMPLGPYLSMAAVALVLSWPWFWPGVARIYFDTFRMLLLGQET